MRLPFGRRLWVFRARDPENPDGPTGIVTIRTRRLTEKRLAKVKRELADQGLIKPEERRPE